MKRQELIRQGLGRCVSVIDLSLDRFEDIEKIIERREEADPMARRVLMVNEACVLPSTDTAEAWHDRQRDMLRDLRKFVDDQTAFGTMEKDKWEDIFKRVSKHYIELGIERGDLNPRIVRFDADLIKKCDRN